MSVLAVSERFEALVNLLGDGNQATFAKRVNLPTDIVADMVAGRLARVGFRTCQRLFEHIPALSKNWLFSGVGPMLEEAQPAASASEPSNSQTTKILARMGETVVPYMPNNQVGEFISNEAIWCETIRLPAALLPHSMLRPEHLVAFDVQTDGLEPELTKGDVLVCAELDSRQWQWLSAPHIGLVVLIDGTIELASFSVDRFSNTLRWRVSLSEKISRCTPFSGISQLWVKKLQFSRNTSRVVEQGEQPVDEDPVPFADALRAARKAKKMTQAALGAAVGMTNAAISLLETGTSQPSAKVRQALAQALDVDFIEAQ